MSEGSVVISAGNRLQDSAIIKTMSSALINRMVHIQLTANPRNWLKWVRENGIHPRIIEYITQRPDHLFSQPPKTGEPFSIPCSWHMLSDALWGYRAGETELSPDTRHMLAYSCLTPSHAGMFLAFTKISSTSTGWTR